MIYREFQGKQLSLLGFGAMRLPTLSDGTIDEAAISALECVHDGQYVKLYKAPESTRGYIDRSSGRAIVGF